MINLFHQCPACGSPLIITECQCPACKLQLRGEFQLDRFSRLTNDQLAFIRVFLSARGNLTETEKILGISYPTIRNKLEEINAALEQKGNIPLQTASAVSGNAIENERQSVLQKVAQGQLSAAEALRQLQGK